MVRLQVDAEPGCLDAVHALLAELWASEPDIDAGARTRFAIAVAELTANVVEHGRTADGGRPRLTVELTAGADALRATVADDGIAYAVDVPAEPPAPLVERGRGLVLARMAVDELRYARSGGHNHWTLAVALRAPGPR